MGREALPPVIRMDGQPVDPAFAPVVGCQHCTDEGSVFALYAYAAVLEKAKRLEQLLQRVAAGEPLDEVNEAFRLLEDREVFGKVVLRP